MFLEPLCGLNITQGKRRTERLRHKIEVGENPLEWKRGNGSRTSLDEAMSSSASRVSFESSSSSSRLARSSASSLRSEGSACSCFDSGLALSMDIKDHDRDVDSGLASWELRLQGQSYYSHEVGQIEDDLWRKGIDCWISMV